MYTPICIYACVCTYMYVCVHICVCAFYMYKYMYKIFVLTKCTLAWVKSIFLQKGLLSCTSHIP